MQRMINEGRVWSHRYDGFWQCMDTYREMCLLNEMWAKGSAPWQVWQECNGNRLTA